MGVAWFRGLGVVGAAAVLVVALLPAAIAADEATEAFEPISSWPLPGAVPGPTGSGPRSVALDAGGNVVVTKGDPAAGIGEWQVYSGLGRPVDRWETHGDPFGVAIGRSGLAYVVVPRADDGELIQVYRNGLLVRAWGVHGAGRGEFEYPHGVAVDSNENVYVTDWVADKVVKFNAAGTFIREWGATGSGNGQFDAPVDIAVDEDDRVYVSEEENHRIQKFTRHGRFIDAWVVDASDPRSQPDGLGTDHRGHVYVADSWTAWVYKFTTGGVSLGRFGTGSTVLDVAADGYGNVYVLSGWHEKRVFRLLDTAMAPTCGGKAPTILGTLGNDALAGTSGNDVIVGLSGRDRIVAKGGRDYVCGNAGRDSLYGGTGPDIVWGGSSSDVIDGGGGNDVISGGRGVDVASFAKLDAAVVVSLDKRVAVGQGRDRLVSVESVVGSPRGDRLIGDAGPNRLLGRAGDDRLAGLAGNDVLVGGRGVDRANGGPGTDRCSAETVRNCG